MRIRARAAELLALVGFLGAACGGGGDEGGGLEGSGSGKGGSGPRGGGGGAAGTIIGTAASSASGGVGTGNTGGVAGSDECATSTATATPEAPVVLFLVDTSLSMDEDAPGSQQSKWVETRDALANAFDDLPNGMGVGLQFYPNVPANSMPCFDSEVHVPIAPLTMMQRNRLDMALQQADTNGSTPTHDAYEFALDALDMTSLAGARYVVLITDGIPTYALGCQGSGMQSNPAPTQPLIDASAAAMASQIRTFVIGSPGSENARASLSQMASNGGTATPGCSNSGPEYCHLDMTEEPNFSAALAGALDDVIAGIPLTCDFPIPDPPAGAMIDRSKVNVNYTDSSGNTMPIGRDPDPNGTACTTGWQYTSGGAQITLCGDLCDEVKADPNASIELVFGCATITNPPVL